jgi:Protein of unknown function (DUF2793)
MADIKIIYVNADGLNQEHSESADSVKFLSFKTANNELTDAKLGRLVDGVDATDEHIHDARYFREDEHITSSVGAGDAGKPVKTDVDGKISASLIDVADLNDELDHGSLLGLADDDHTQYILVAGTRPFTGIQSYTTHPSFSDDKQLVDKKYVDDLFSGSEWYNSVLSATILTPPGSPTTGDRYLINGTGLLGWAGKDNQIAEWSGSAWIYTVPTAGAHVSSDAESSVIYIFNGTSWDAKSYESTTASNGLVKVGNDIRIDSGAAGAGLAFSAGVLSVNVDGSSLEINSDTLRVKALGIKDTMIDFGTGAGQISAVDVPLADVGGYFPTDNVEAALQKLAADITEQGVLYTVGTGGVNKGDLCYVSLVNTVNKLSTLSDNEYCVGLALATTAAAGSVKVLSNDTVLTGVLTAASAGDIVYWSGSGPVFTAPATSGQNVWQIGVAKNATDLHVEVRQVKKNG